jgi:hypothetical protein
MTLHYAAAIETMVLDDAPVELPLPVLPPFGPSQEDGGEAFAPTQRIGDSAAN